MTDMRATPRLLEFIVERSDDERVTQAVGELQRRGDTLVRGREVLVVATAAFAGPTSTAASNSVPMTSSLMPSSAWRTRSADARLGADSRSTFRWRPCSALALEVATPRTHE
jgi:hypothetical protein